MEKKNALPESISLSGRISKSLSQFLGWWKKELLGLLRPAMRERLSGRKNYLILEKTQMLFRARYGFRGNLESLGQFVLGSDEPDDQTALSRIKTFIGKADEIVLFLPPDELLNKTISFPSATEHEIQNVVAYEMDRYTPFSAEQVYYGCQVTGRDETRQRISVLLTLIPRKKLDHTLNALSLRGIHPVVVAPAAQASDQLYAFNLLPDSEQSLRLQRKRARQRWQWTLLVLILVGSVVALIQNQNSRLQQLQDMLADPQAQAEAARQVKSELKLLNDSRTFLITQKHDEMSVLVVLDELTRMLPDHTWISRMEWKDNALKLQGESAEASALISLLEDSVHLYNVRFASPVTTNPRSQKERFVILAQLRKGDGA